MIAIFFRHQFLFLLVAFLPFIYGFNVDTANPIYRFGPHNTYFGFSIAQHFVNEDSVLIVGAPRAESGQPGTTKAGAVFSCRINFRTTGISLFNADNCTQLQVEYPTEDEFRRPPQRLNSKILHNEGKNHQLLGFVVESTGQKYGNAMVCAPLLRYGHNAYTDGACYLLNTELNHTGVISTCNPLPKKDRHNDYGACEQGFSGYIDNNVILTGLPGARKWTGGVFSRYEFNSNGFPDTVDRWTMEVNKDQNGVINILASHDYLGYSIGYGRFGFWFEELDRSNFTIVSGATRFQQLGAIVFLPFRKNSHPEEERLLGLDDNFTISGQQLGSYFGAAIQVIDLNNDGFDDLIVGAPYEYYYDEDIGYGGAVYIFYSAGVIQKRGDNHKVFRQPIILRGKGAHSQFGIALTKLGNLDNDANGYQDFAVGAPQADDGQGAVFIYHGADYDLFVRTPAQEIHANTLHNPFNFEEDISKAKQAKKKNKKLKKFNNVLLNFGSALAGGVDMDGNKYNELAVGSFGSDTVIVFRTKPVVDVQLQHKFPHQYVKIDDRRFSGCPSNARTCFILSTGIKTDNRNNTAELLNFEENPFICLLEIIPFAKFVGSRAIFVDRNKTSTSWACGRNSLYIPHEQSHQIYVPHNNQDWTHPLRFNFSVTMRENRVNELLPAINRKYLEHIFDISFNKKCGDDNDCHTDLSISAILLNITRRADGTYFSKVTERDVIVIRFVVENKKERAFLAKFFIEYDQNELDEPQKIQHKSPIDIEKKSNGLAVISLGNPLEEDKKLSFDLSFNLVRGSLERVSASLSFKAYVNSTSIEDDPSNNDWQAEVQLIKEADLQLDGASLPLVVRFSNGNPTVTDEEDIGQEVVHVYTLTNHGPFYAKNVTVTIHWPLKLNTERENDDWTLYTLEEPVIRHSGEIRKCRSPDRKAINPLNVYNDETLRLTYMPTYKHLRKTRSVVKDEKEKKNLLDVSDEKEHDFSIIGFLFGKYKANENGDKMSSIFDGRFIKPKEIEESSGSRVRIVDVNCKDQTALCVPIVCDFDYVGTNDAALIEIRSRFWNYTFSGNYKLIEYFAITSDGYVEVDPAQGIIENIRNNFAKVTTHAYPDRPLQDDRVDFWIILLAVLAGLLLLSIFILICWRCGFFKRKRSHDLTLHQASRLNELEQWQ